MWLRHGLPVILATLASIGFAACSSSSSGIGLKSADGSTGTGGLLTVDGATSAVDASGTGGMPGTAGTPSAIDAPGVGGMLGTGGTSGVVDAPGAGGLPATGGTQGGNPSNGGAGDGVVEAGGIVGTDGIGGAGGILGSGGIAEAVGIGFGGSGGASDAGAGGPRFVLENYGADMCDPTTRSTNGTITATGRIWLLKNGGGSGTMDVTVSVTGASNVLGSSIPGEPDISRQFSVLAGASYALVVGLPVTCCGGCGAASTVSGFAYGPRVTVAFSGMPTEDSNYPFSFTVAAFGPYTLTCPGGESVIGLEEGSSTRVQNYTGNFVAPCISLPSPAGCITTNSMGATCSVAGDLYCGGTVCCSPSYPYFCSATQKCYSTSGAAAKWCGSMSCAQCAAPS
jgi:hypothetical protein